MSSPARSVHAETMKAGTADGSSRSAPGSKWLQKTLSKMTTRFVMRAGGGSTSSRWCTPASSSIAAPHAIPTACRACTLSPSHGVRSRSQSAIGGNKPTASDLAVSIGATTTNSESRLKAAPARSTSRPATRACARQMSSVKLAASRPVSRKLGDRAAPSKPHASAASAMHLYINHE
eukprot:scaffold91892_cov26-Tisochrysis_lutea.AAC.3